MASSAKRGKDSDPQNDFIVNNLFSLDKSATMSTLTVEVIKMKFAKLFTDINSDSSKAE